MAGAFVLGLLSDALDVVDRFTDDESPPLQLGEEGTSGPFALTPTEVTCDTTLDDVPEQAREDLPAGLLEELTDPSHQICTATVRVRNSSDTQYQGFAAGILYVREARYQALLWYEIAPLLSPDQSFTNTIVFVLPKGSTPTKLELQAFPPIVGEAPEPVEYVLP